MTAAPDSNENAKLCLDEITKNWPFIQILCCAVCMFWSSIIMKFLGPLSKKRKFSEGKAILDEVLADLAKSLKIISIYSDKI